MRRRKWWKKDSFERWRLINKLCWRGSGRGSDLLQGDLKCFMKKRAWQEMSGEKIERIMTLKETLISFWKWKASRNNFIELIFQKINWLMHFIIYKYAVYKKKILSTVPNKHVYIILPFMGWRTCHISTLKSTFW